MDDKEVVAASTSDETTDLLESGFRPLRYKNQLWRENLSPEARAELVAKYQEKERRRKRRQRIRETYKPPTPEMRETWDRETVSELETLFDSHAIAPFSNDYVLHCKLPPEIPWTQEKLFASTEPSSDYDSYMASKKSQEAIRNSRRGYQGLSARKRNLYGS